MNLTRSTLTALLKKNHGYFTTGQAAGMGLDRWTLTRLVQQGHIVRLAQGLYAQPDTMPSPYIVAQHRCSLGIFSHETALFLHGMSDRVPLRLMMTIPSGWNSPLLKDAGMMFFYNRKEWFEMGLTHIRTPEGPEVRCYDIERTLCDCVRALDRLDRDIVLGALKAFMKQENASRPKLLHYAQTLGIRDIMYRYLEVLA